VTRILKVIVLTAWTALAAPPAAAQSSAVDIKASRQLTSYFRTHRLPLVGAQVMSSDGGGKRVVVYGFVATPFGRVDAENKAREFLKQPNLKVVNRIQVRPEIRDLKNKSVDGDEDEAEPEKQSRDPWAGILRDMRSNGLALPDDNQFGPP
jgi:hypothetical protein